MNALNRKLLRDIASFKGQVAAIAVIIGSGVMVLILFATILEAINQSRDRYYQGHNFAHVFTEIKRAPESVSERIRAIPGVSLAETRVKAPVRISVEDFKDPVQGEIISIPDGRQPDLNRLYLRQGILPEPGYLNQVLVSEPFALAHNFQTGHTLRAIIKGRMETLTISGIVLSPEYVYQIGPTDLIPDYKRFAVLWMNRSALAGAFGMEGAFNNLVLSLHADADEQKVIEAVDHILAQYGSVGAYGRRDQTSNRFLQEELDQLRVMTIVLPAIFLGVSAFLLNVLMARIIRTQRQQIAVLKAFGYTNVQVGLHFVKFTALIVCMGSALGVGMGAWAAHAMSGLYAEYFRFPEMDFGLQPATVVLSILVAFGAGLAGTFRAVAGAAGQAPAEAMRPPAPERFSKGVIEQSFLGKVLGQTGRMILRNISRYRFKTMMSMLGISLSGSLILLGSYQFESVNHMLDVQYRLVQRMDISLSFNEPVSSNAMAGLAGLPGVHYVESYRSVPVRLSHNRLEYRTSILGLDRDAVLRVVVDKDLQPVAVPPEGLLMTSYLAGYLGAVPGDLITVEVMEGHRRTLELPLAGTVEEPVGISAYMDRPSLNIIMREGPAISGAWLLTDETSHDQLFARLHQMPQVAGIGVISTAEANIRGYIEDTVLIFMVILLILAGSIAFAVVYNNARVAFAERSRELATLRVLGFTRAEVAWILIGEIGLITLLSIPVGWILGTGFALLLNHAMSSELFRLPFVLSPAIFAFSALGVIAASVLSLFFIAGKLRRLDMVTALKTE